MNDKLVVSRIGDSSQPVRESSKIPLTLKTRQRVMPVCVTIVSRTDTLVSSAEYRKPRDHVQHPWQQQHSSDHDQSCVAYGHRLPPCPDASCSFRSRIANCSARIAASRSSAVRSRRAASLRRLDRCCSNSSLTAHSITHTPLTHYCVIGLSPIYSLSLTGRSRSFKTQPRALNFENGSAMTRIAFEWTFVSDSA